MLNMDNSFIVSRTSCDKEGYYLEETLNHSFIVYSLVFNLGELDMKKVGCKYLVLE